MYYLRSSFLLTHVNSNAFLVAADTSPPWTDAVDVELSPYAKRIARARWLYLDNFGTIMPGMSLI